MLPLKKGAEVLHIVITAPPIPRLLNVRLADALVNFIAKMIAKR